MTKQEEIREGIADIIAKYHNQVPFANEVPEILSYLNNSDVVIKVDREFNHLARNQCCNTTEDLHLVTVEPLILQGVNREDDKR